MRHNDRFALVCLILAVVAGLALGVALFAELGWIGAIIGFIIPPAFVAEGLGRMRNGI